MENEYEDGVRKAWELEAKKKQKQERDADRPRKRLRELESGDVTTGADVALSIASGLQSIFQAAPGGSNAKTKKGGKVTAPRAAATRARGRVTDILDDEDEEVVDVD